jgi:hypothetical protein
MGASKGGRRKLIENLSLFALLVWGVVCLLVALGVAYVAALLVGGAVLGTMVVVKQLLPVLVPAGLIAVAVWCIAPIVQRKEATLRAALGTMGSRVLFACFIIFFIAINTDIIDSTAVLKWVTIGSFSALLLMNAYERLDRWYSSKRSTVSGEEPDGPRTVA